jgi:hypothetical protein
MSEQQNPSPTITVTATDSAVTPVYFPVSLLKLVVMSTCTFGIYQLYWYYQKWCSIKEHENRRQEKLEIMPLGRAVFAPFFCYSLFRRVQTTAEAQGILEYVAPGMLAAGWILLTALGKLPDPYWLVSFLAVGCLLPVQAAINKINAITAQEHDPNGRFTAWNIVVVVIGGLGFVGVLVGTFLPFK